MAGTMNIPTNANGPKKAAKLSGIISKKLPPASNNRKLHGAVSISGASIDKPSGSDVINATTVKRQRIR